MSASGKICIIGTMLSVFMLYGSLTYSQVASSQNDGFNPGCIWPDNNGKHINAHGGGILFYKGVYYWYGEFKVAGEIGNSAQVGVSCYTSTDLLHWKDEGIALKVEEKDTTSEIIKGCIIERPKVVFNKKTGKFVMWFHLELKGHGYGDARTAVAVSDNPEGPFTYVRSYNPNPGFWPIHFKDQWKQQQAGEDQLKWWTDEWRQAVSEGFFVRRDFKEGQMSRDMTIFVDDNGKAYHIHASEENLTLHIAELTDDYLSFTGKWTAILPAGHNEAPALCKYHGKYYLITSGCTGWAPNAARSAVADSIWGAWKPLGNPCIGKDSSITFNSQSTFILPVEGKKDAFIFMADRWTPKNPIDGRYIWLPLEFENDKPVIRWRDQWSMSFFK